MKEECYLEFAKEIANEAGKIMKKYFTRKDISQYKGDKTIVTIADKEINSYLIKRVKETFPNHSVDGEEEVFGISDYVWVCDPIDGTAMYARGIPVSTFSLALVVDGVPKVGVIYDPFTENMYSAIKGKGAFQNSKKIQVNDYSLEDIKTMCHCDMGSKSGYNMTKITQELMIKTYVSDIGSIARACSCVASGEYTMAVFAGNEHKNCDIAAAKIIVEEAGGKVTNLFGEEQRYDTSIKGAIISNGIVHDEVKTIIEKYLKTIDR